MIDQVTVTITIPSQLAFLKMVRNLVIEASRAMIKEELEPSRSAWEDQLVLAVTEACTNVIKHTYKGEPNHQVCIKCKTEPDRFIVVLLDQGESFNFNQIPQPDLSVPHEGGYGVYIMKKLMDEVRYNAGQEEGNELVLVKMIKKQGEPS